MNVKDIQLEQLNGLIAAIEGRNAFYTKKLREAGVSGKVSSLEEFVEKIPFTTKRELVEDQKENGPYGSNLTFPIEAYTRFSQTSATSGKPMVWLDTADNWAWMLKNWCMIFNAAGVQRGDILFFAFSFGPFLGFWTAYEAAVGYGCRCIPGGAQSSVERLRSIILHKVRVLCCTPSYAMHLVFVAEQEGIDLSKSSLELVIVAGEPGGSSPAFRQRFSEGWPGARIYDHHGMTEVGPVTFQDPLDDTRLRILETRYFPEFIDPESGKAVAWGEIGELILTPLGRFGSPLLRFRTGDLVRAVKLDDDSMETLALEGGILARSDDMVVIRGVNLFPCAVDEVVRSVSEITEYRVEVDRSGAMAQISLQIELLPGSNFQKTSDELERRLHAAFSLRMPVSAVGPGSLPRFEMKAKRWVFTEESS